MRCGTRLTALLCNFRGIATVSSNSCHPGPPQKCPYPELCSCRLPRTEGCVCVALCSGPPRATPAEGHYRAAFFEDDRVLYANDNKAAVTANARHIAEISTNCYVLYLTREEMFDTRRAAL